MEIKRLVIDVLIPTEPSVITYAERISELPNIDGVTIWVSEIDEKTRTLKIAIEGSAVMFKAIEDTIGYLGGSIHSIDEVSAGRRIIKLDSRGSGEG